jgi:Asp-tRNA(Asn)/Glu-tRNA(Gln) amidotransferase A subunit family amidase
LQLGEHARALTLAVAETSQDCALLLNAIAGHDPSDPASSSRPVEDFAKGIDGGIKGLRILRIGGGPALALPCGFSKNGLPLSLQIAGRPQEDALVPRAGYAYETAGGTHAPTYRDGLT